MSNPIYINQPCAPGPAGCSLLQRNVVANVNSGVIADGFTNALAWLNAFDLTTLAWGTALNATFNTGASTVPDSSSLGGSYGPASSGFDNYEPSGGEDDFAYAMRTQVLLPAPAAYLIVAITEFNEGSDEWGEPAPGPGYWPSLGFIEGCTGQANACANIIDLPVPDVGQSIGYEFHLVGETLEGTTYNTLADAIPPVPLGDTPYYTAPTWNTAQLCSWPGDPFAAP